jgi:tRNA(fMet)-specific endonuclease VapC
MRDNQAAAQRALELLLEDVPTPPFDDEAGASYGIIRASIRDRKRDSLNRLTAVHAMSLSLALITNDEADFKDYPDSSLEN